MTSALREGLRTTWTARWLVKDHSFGSGAAVRTFVASEGVVGNVTSSLDAKSLNSCSQEVGEDSLNQLIEFNGSLDPATYASLLRWCGDQKSLSNGKRVHDHILRSGLGRNTFLGGLVVQMYGKCGALEHALAQFASMQERNLFSWNFTVRACAQQGQWQVSLELFNHMQQEAVLPDKFTYVSVLSACVFKGSFSDGKKMHARIINSIIESDIAIATSVVNMYGKCGSSKDVLEIFEGMPDHDVIAWNAVIAAYSQNRNGYQALYFFEKMQQEGVMPNKITFVSIFDACANQAELKEGKRLHARILCSVLESDVVVGNVIINMYGKCGSLKNAWMMFDQMSKRNVVSWTAMITSCSLHGQIEDALQCFSQMILEGTLPENVTFVSIISACGRHLLLAEGERIHACLQNASDVVVGTALINMYGSCGGFKDAQKVFGSLPVRDRVAWNAMITVSAQYDYVEEAIELLHQMLWENVIPDAVTFISILSACASTTRLDVGKQVHAYIVDCGFESTNLVGNSLITMYGKCGSSEDAWKTFIRMSQWDVVSWNAMITVYSLHGKVVEALGLFDVMQFHDAMPDQVTFISILEAYARYPVTTKNGLTHTDDCHDVECMTAVETAHTIKYGKFRVVEDSQRIFDGLHEQDVNLWNALIAVHMQHGKGSGAILFDRMQAEGVLPNITTFITVLSACSSQARLAEGKRMHARIMNDKVESDIALGTALVSMYGRCGRMDDARRVFDRISSGNVVSWTAMIAVYAQNDEGLEALKVFLDMLQCSVLPNKVTLVSILVACSSEVALEEGKKVHMSVLSIGLEADVVIETALVYMYAKCGCVELSQSIFDQMPDHDVILWNAMITMYGQHGLGREALHFFDRMQQEGVAPDKVTFVGILTACSHSGLIEEGIHCFNSMVHDHCIHPAVDHYVCMVDLLGRTGRLDDAVALIDNMPVQTTGVPYMAILGACRQPVDLKCGEWAALHVFELDPVNTAPYVILSNMYAAGGRHVVVQE